MRLASSFTAPLLTLRLAAVDPTTDFPLVTLDAQALATQAQLDQALADVWVLLADAAADADGFTLLLQQVFGHADAALIEELVAGSGLAGLGFVVGAEVLLGGSEGVCEVLGIDGTATVSISETLLNSGDAAAIQSVLLEQIGVVLAWRLTGSFDATAATAQVFAATLNTSMAASPVVVADASEDQLAAAQASASGLRVEQLVAEQLSQVWMELRQGAAEPGFQDLLVDVFASSSTDPSAFDTSATALASQLAAGEQLGLRFEIESGAEMGSTAAAYAAVGDDGVATIYLNGDWLTTASNDQLRLALLEEIGHRIDTLLNGSVDTAGDEGELFAKLFSGMALNEEQLAAMANENDSNLLLIDGRQVVTEASATSISISSISDDSGLIQGVIGNGGSSDDATPEIVVGYSTTTSAGNRQINLWRNDGASTSLVASLVTS
ncbi:MAG: hypothetical protein RLZZ219_1596, partial [Cyanobacteriota bacterium]